MLVVVGSADYLTGHEIQFSIFYLVAVAVAAWAVGTTFAVVISLLSVGAWLVGDLASGAVYPHPIVPVWNAAIVLAFYLVVIGLIRRLRTVHRELEERVRQRTTALTEEMAERMRLEREVLDIGDRERRRIGRDLHDSLGQHLTGTALAGQVLEERLGARGMPEAGDAARIVSMVEQAIEVTRRLSHGLDPVEFEGGGLAYGLRELAAQTTALGGVLCDCETSTDVAIQEIGIATQLYRIAQEAVANAVKHGHARRITLRLDDDPGLVRLTVRDDGVGIPDRGARGNGMGLRVMAHRAAVSGGRFDIRREPSGGTVVTCEMPRP